MSAPDVNTVPGWPVAFRGSAAIAAGLITRGELRGKLRSLAAYRYAEGKGVLSGYSAAELLGASCEPWDALAEVTVPRGSQRGPADLIVHRTHLHPGEITQVKGLKGDQPRPHRPTWPAAVTWSKRWWRWIGWATCTASPRTCC